MILCHSQRLAVVVATELLDAVAGFVHLVSRHCQHHTEEAWVLETLQTRTGTVEILPFKKDHSCDRQTIPSFLSLSYIYFCANELVAKDRPLFQPTSV